MNPQKPACRINIGSRRLLRVVDAVEPVMPNRKIDRDDLLPIRQKPVLDTVSLVEIASHHLAPVIYAGEPPALVGGHAGKQLQQGGRLIVLEEAVQLGGGVRKSADTHTEVINAVELRPLCWIDVRMVEEREGIAAFDICLARRIGDIVLCGRSHDLAL